MPHQRATDHVTVYTPSSLVNPHNEIRLLILSNIPPKQCYRKKIDWYCKWEGGNRLFYEDCGAKEAVVDHWDSLCAAVLIR